MKVGKGYMEPPSLRSNKNILLVSQHVVLCSSDIRLVVVWTFGLATHGVQPMTKTQPLKVQNVSIVNVIIVL